MKTTLKIAVMAMMGMSLGANAYSNPNEICKEITTKIASADVTYCNTLIANSYVKVYQITTTSGQLASNVRVSATSHTTSHVGNFTADILVNHSRDIFVKSISGDYTQGTIKIESNNSGSYFMSYKTTSSNAGRYYFTIEPLSSEVTITPLPTGQAPTGTVHEHQTNFGTHESGTGGVLKAVYEGNVGIGTTTPGAKLDVNGDIMINRVVKIDGKGNVASLQIMDNTNTQTADILLRGDGGNSFIKAGKVGIGTTTPQAKLNVEGTFQVGTTANYDGGVLSTSYENGSLSLNMIEYDDPLVMSFKQTLNPDYHEKIYFNKGGFGIGISDTKGFKLGVNGKVAATEVKVATYANWADFVFYDDYQLPTLTEVEKHIKEKGHLKDIPSAKEVEKNGFFLGEMDAKLLQKIEELTLYTIEQEKKIKVLEKQQTKLEEQEKKIEKLELLVTKLLKEKN